MPDGNYSIQHNQLLVATASDYAAGTCVVPTTTGEWIIATAANRALYGSSGGILRTAGNGTRMRMVDVQFCGLVPASVANLGVGTEGQWVRTSAAGVPERVTSPGAGDDVIGKAKADGSFESLFGGLVDTSSGGGTPAGGTGAVQYNNAGAFAAIAPNAASGKPLVSNGAGAPPIYDAISLANNAAVVAPGAAQELLVNDGTGAVSFADEVRAGGTYLSIGTNPAASGGGRLANNVAWKARNPANSADRQLCVLNGSDVVVLGDTSAAMTLDASASGVSIPSGVLKIGSGTLSTTGETRHANATVGARFRNAADSADLTVWETNSSNNVYFGINSTFDGNKVALLALGASSIVQIFQNTSTALYITDSGVGVYQNRDLQIYGGSGSAPSDGGGVGVIAFGNAGTNPSSNPTGGGVMWAEGGAGKWRGSGGTITTFAAAEPHCPRCGTDVGISQSENDIFGEELIHCHACELRTGNGVVRHVADFFERKAA